MEDEGEKRKPENNDVNVSETAKKKLKEEMKTELISEEVAEEEVEEFFAILRRIQVAVKYFSSKVDGASGSGVQKMTYDIEQKCSDEFLGDNNEDCKGKGIEENKGFDLNMDPCDTNENKST
ncbi:uncharacterized protein LOC142178471 [Nicotiana tabacum]|uniref:Uncharacterized protein LOC142178471 n=1 Tax=Nicotiana tabacum TaxID=4097 RepID=A0AC58U3U7_TOBAC